MNTPYAVKQVSLDIFPSDHPHRVSFTFDISDAIFPILYANLGAMLAPEAQPNVILRPEPGVVSYSWTDVLGYREVARISGVIASGYASKVLNRREGEALDNAVRMAWQNIATLCSDKPSAVPLGMSSTLRASATSKTITFSFDAPQEARSKALWPELLDGPVKESRRTALWSSCHKVGGGDSYVWEGMDASYELVRVTNLLAQMFAHVGLPVQASSVATRLSLEEAWRHLAPRFR